MSENAFEYHYEDEVKMRILFNNDTGLTWVISIKALLLSRRNILGSKAMCPSFQYH